MRKLKGTIKSKTMWFNSVLVFVWVFLEITNEMLPVLQQYLPEAIYKWVGLIVVLVNMYLRTKTKTSLGEK